MANPKTTQIKRTTIWEIPNEFVETIDELEANDPDGDDDDDFEDDDDLDDDDHDDYAGE
jgi:hypothetical protein